MAKLVEILARELKEWPEGAESAVQDSDGEVKFSRSANLPRMDRIKTVWLRHEDAGGETLWVGARAADDYTTAIVTRAEWQAAVDALYPPLAIKEEWDGVGLPPVGTACERRFPDVQESSWNGCIILAHGARKIFVRDNCGDEWAHHLDEVEFRPFRTPEQIAAEDRDLAIAEMVATAKMATGFGQNVADHAALYDAGYRKQEQK